MDAAIEEEIRELRDRYRSSRDPDGRAFAPLADAYRRAGELEDAASLVDEGLERLPDFAPGHLVAGRVFRDRGDAAAAASAFERVLELDPDNVEALREAAGVAEAEGRMTEALELYHRLSHLEAGGTTRDRIRDLKRRRFESGRPGAAEEDEVAEDEASETVAPPPAADGEPADEEPAVAASGPAEPEAGEEVGEVDESGPSEPMEEGPAETGDEEVYTRTMAELYTRQGLESRAVEIYRRLVDRNPDDTGLRARLEELEAGRTVGPAVEASGETTRAGDEEESAPDPSIAAYFRRLLRWPAEGAGPEDESGTGGAAGAAESAGPEEGAGPKAAGPAVSTGEIVPIEALAPDAPPEEDDDFRSWLRGMQR